MKELTDAEVLALRKMVVSDNKIIAKIHNTSIYMGAGNTNQSGVFDGGRSEYIDISTLDGKSFYTIEPFHYVAAIVNDIAYVVCDGKVKRYKAGDHINASIDIAYDTLERFTVTFCSK